MFLIDGNLLERLSTNYKYIIHNASILKQFSRRSSQHKSNVIVRNPFYRIKFANNREKCMRIDVYGKYKMEIFMYRIYNRMYSSVFQ